MKEFDAVIFDVTWKSLDYERKRFKDIDAKAIGIITIMGVLMTFLVNFAKPVDSEKISILLFALTALSFFSTIFLSVLVIRTRIGPELLIQKLIKELKNEPPDNQIRGIIGTIAKICDDFQVVCRKKAYDLRNAICALGISVAVLILYYLSIFL